MPIYFFGVFLAFSSRQYNFIHTTFFWWPWFSCGRNLIQDYIFVWGKCWYNKHVTHNKNAESTLTTSAFYDITSHSTFVGPQDSFESLGELFHMDNKLLGFAWGHFGDEICQLFAIRGILYTKICCRNSGCGTCLIFPTIFIQPFFVQEVCSKHFLTNPKLVIWDNLPMNYVQDAACSESLPSRFLWNVVIFHLSVGLDNQWGGTRYFSWTFLEECHLSPYSHELCWKIQLYHLVSWGVYCHQLK